jgi:ribose transport system permease protein
MIDNIMSVMQINPFLKDVVRGIVIVAAVAVYAGAGSSAGPARFDDTPRRPLRHGRRWAHEHPRFGPER